MKDLKDSEIYPKYTFRLTQDDKDWLERELEQLKIKFNDPSMGEYHSISKSTILMAALRKGIYELKASEPMTENKITKKIELQASQAQVWAALTQEEQLGQWWQKGMRITPVPGGEFYEPWKDREGNDHLATGKVLEVQPERQISFTWHEQEWKKNEITRCTFKLVKIPSGIELVVEHSGWGLFPQDLQEQLKSKFSAGWDYVLRSLNKYLEVKN